MESLLPAVKSISDLIDDFESGNIAIPEIQRDVVWKAEPLSNLPVRERPRKAPELYSALQA